LDQKFTFGPTFSKSEVHAIVGSTVPKGTTVYKSEKAIRAEMAEIDLEISKLEPIEARIRQRA
jgi:hypothetical protein